MATDQEALRKRLVDRIRSLEKAVWVFCGDSITHGARHTFGRRDYVELISERVRFEKQMKMHLFVNSAASGNTTQPIVQNLDHRVIRFQPDFFFLMIGMNDCARLPIEEFEKNLLEILRRVRSETPAEMTLQTANAIDPDKVGERKPYPQFMDVVRKIAANQEIFLMDHQKEWEKTRLENPALYATWMNDAVHPGALGHWVFAERILKELEIGGLEGCAAPNERG